MEAVIDEYVRLFSEQGINKYNVIRNTIYGHLSERYKDNKYVSKFNLELISDDIAESVALRLNVPQD